MSSTANDPQAFIERQPRLAGRRRWMLRILKPIAYGLLWQVDVTGLENIPKSGGTVLMMNHISAIDPIVCMGAVESRFVIPMSKIENMQHAVLGPFLKMWDVYTVDRDGLDRKAVSQSVELLKSGQLILIAPEGTRNRDGLTEAKDGLTFIATKANAAVVPALSYTNGWHDSLKRFRQHSIKLHFGRAFRFKTNGRKRIPREELAQMTRESMYHLASSIHDTSKRGAYSATENHTTETLQFLKVLDLP